MHFFNWLKTFNVVKDKKHKVFFYLSGTKDKLLMHSLLLKSLLTSKTIFDFLMHDFTST